MLQYKALELHSHTKHSDGQFTVQELLEHAHARKYDGIALTDHNTMSGFKEITPELEKSTLPVIHGIEWTTFFGHMLVLNAKKYVDWRLAEQDTIDLYTKAIQKVGGVIGIAHPFVFGSPVCTGCHWEFTVKDWNLIDYIEVWSTTYPNTHSFNQQSLGFWTELLKKGYKISATSGRDWHNPDKDDERPHAAATYVGIEEAIVTSDNAADGIKRGRVFVTAGPYMDIKFTKDNKEYNLGDEIDCGVLEISVKIVEDVRSDIWAGFNIKTKTIKIIHNGDIVEYYNGIEGKFTINVTKGFLKVEIYGDYLEKHDQLLGFSSPLYIG